MVDTEIKMDRGKRMHSRPEIDIPFENCKQLNINCDNQKFQIGFANIIDTDANYLWVKTVNTIDEVVQTVNETYQSNPDIQRICFGARPGQSYIKPVELIQAVLSSPYINDSYFEVLFHPAEDEMKVN